MKLVGIEVKNGVFEKDGRKIEYNNLLLHTTSETLQIVKDDNGVVTKWGVGSKVETHKVKNDEENLKNVFGVNVDEKLLTEMIGQDINIYYNAYGKIEKIMFVKPVKA